MALEADNWRLALVKNTGWRKNEIIRQIQKSREHFFELELSPRIWCTNILYSRLVLRKLCCSRFFSRVRRNPRHKTYLIQKNVHTFKYYPCHWNYLSGSEFLTSRLHWNKIHEISFIRNCHTTGISVSCSFQASQSLWTGSRASYKERAIASF